MDYFHLEAKIISRGSGRSAVAAAAYASCSRLHNNYDGITHDYTQKHGCIYSEIFLPENAPAEWHSRQSLWNAVENVERTKDSRLARELIIALPTELSKNVWIKMVKDFTQEQCVGQGMCADINIHDTDGNNPHAHILLTVRPLDRNGNWQAKTQKEYLCRCGEEERGFTAQEFKEVQNQGWEKQYKYLIGKKKEYLTPSEAKKIPDCTRTSKSPKSTRFGRQNPISAVWNSEEQLLSWRKAWEVIINAEQERHGIEDRVDCRSNAARGIDAQPTVHEGYHARKMEASGYLSERCELNRLIRADNKLLKELKSAVDKLLKQLEHTAESIAAALESIRSHMIILQYQLLFNHNQLSSIIAVLSRKLPKLEKYHSIQIRIKELTAKRKAITAQKKSYSPLQINKHLQCSRQLTALTENLEELKSHKSQLLSQLGCTTDAELKSVSQQLEGYQKKQDILKSRQKGLIQQTETDKQKFAKLQEEITPENQNDVRTARWTQRSGNRLTAMRKLQDTYGDLFSRRLFDAAEKAADEELIEKTVSIEKHSVHDYLSKIQERKEPEHSASSKKRQKDYTR